MASAEQEARNNVLAAFDAEVFLNIDVAEANAVVRTLLPQGWLKIDVIEDIDIVPPRQMKQKDSGELFYTRPKLKLTCLIKNEAVRELVNVREGAELRTYPQIDLDIDTATAGLDMGPNRNIALGQLRRALGQNEDGVHWNPRNLRGAGPLYVQVKHDVPDPDKPDNVYERFQSWISAAEFENQPAA